MLAWSGAVSVCFQMGLPLYCLYTGYSEHGGWDQKSPLWFHALPAQSLVCGVVMNSEVPLAVVVWLVEVGRVWEVSLSLLPVPCGQ